MKSLLYILTHNIFINNLAIWFRLENKLKSSNAMWKSYRLDNAKSLQENVGFSHRPDVEEALKKAHEDLINVVKTHLKAGASILDIGCGTGLYLKDLAGKGYHLTGVDMSDAMVDAARQHLPEINFMVGNFMELNFAEKFDLIYSVSVLEYIARNDLESHFRRLYELLNPNGIIFIHYPHALSLLDTLYPDLNYIKYSPVIVEKNAKKFFNILSHRHAFDHHAVSKYDTKVYPSVNGTFKNGYLLIARRRG